MIQNITNSDKYFELTAKTFQGFEGVLATELKKIGAKNVLEKKRAVDFMGDNEILYKANLHLRTATKVFRSVMRFKAFSDSFLNRKILEFDWSRFMTPKDTFSIETNINSKFLKSPAEVTENVKNAIIDHFKKKKQITPTYNSQNPLLRINIHAYNEFCTIFLDSSGDFLFNRQYWSEKPENKLNEGIAAAMILLSGWKKDCNFIDPMCGAGTIPFEAALIAYNIAPNIFRSSFAFMNWKDFDKNIWDKVVNDAKKEETTFRYKISGYDISPTNIRLAKKNQIDAGLLNKISFEVKSFEELKPHEGKGLIVTEPPAETRIGKTDILTFYSKTGDRLKQNFTGFAACILTPNKDAIMSLGLKPAFKKSILNGKIECFYEKYDLTKVPKKNEDDY